MLPLYSVFTFYLYSVHVRSIYGLAQVYYEFVSFSTQSSDKGAVESQEIQCVMCGKKKTEDLRNIHLLCSMFQLAQLRAQAKIGLQQMKYLPQTKRFQIREFYQHKKYILANKKIAQ